MLTPPSKGPLKAVAEVPYCPTPEDWSDLRERLSRAVYNLSDQSEYGPIGERANAVQARKDHKAEGVRLALSYMDEYERQASARADQQPPARDGEHAHG